MNNQELFKISDLGERYKLNSPAAIRSRLQGAGIKPEDQPKRGYVTFEQVDLLDELHSHIRDGNAIADFIQPTVSITSDIEISSIEPTGEMARLIDAIASAIKPDIGLSNFKWLEEAAEYQWRIPTSKVRELVGVTPRPIGGCYLWGSFAFFKEGKMGRETAWAVRRLGGLNNLLKLVTTQENAVPGGDDAA